MSGSSPSGALKRRSLKLSRKSVESEDMNNVDEEEADATPAPVNDSAVDASTPASNRSTPLASPAIDSLPVEKKKGKQRKVDSVAKATDDSDPRPKSSPAAPAVNKLTRYFLVAPSPSVGHPVGTPPGVKTDDADSIRAPPAFVTSSPQADDAHHFRVIVVDNCEKMASELVQLARDSALSAHSFHLATVIQEVVFTRADVSHLFTAEERETFSTLLRLPDGALGLFARLLSRKGPWFRTAALRKYGGDVSLDVHYSERLSDLTKEQLVAAVAPLIDAQAALALPQTLDAAAGAAGRLSLPGTELPYLLQAVESCFRKDDLIRLATYLQSPVDKSATKRTMLDTVTTLLRQQRTMSGSCVGLPALIRRVLMASEDGSFLGSHESALPPLIRLNAATVALIRRAFRLFNLSSSTASVSSGGSGNAVSVRPSNTFAGPSTRPAASAFTARWHSGRDDKEAPDANLRMFSPANSPLLMSIWKRTQYMDVAVRRSCVLFPSRAHLLAYEAACVFVEELDSFSESIRVQKFNLKRAEAAAIDSKAADVLKSEFEGLKSPKLERQVLEAPASKTKPSQTPKSELKRAATAGEKAPILVDDAVDVSSGSDGEGRPVKGADATGRSPLFVFSPQFGLRKDPAACAHGLALSPFVCADQSSSSFDLSSSACGRESCAVMLPITGGDVIDVESSDSGVTGEIDPVVACAWRASYCLAACAALDALMVTDTSTSTVFQTAPGPMPAFLRQFEAGYCFATAVWICVDLLEQGRFYTEANVLVHQILSTRFTPHRRGRCWNRLSINYNHLSKKVEACVACLDGLDDPTVSGGDRLALQKRLTALQRRVASAATAFRNRRGPNQRPFMPVSPTVAVGAGISFPDTLKAIACSLAFDYIGSRSSSMSRLVQFGLPGYVSSEGCWLGGVKGVETILGNPLNRVTGEKSVFIGASQSNPGEVSSVRRERPREGIDTRVDLSRDGYVNVTLTEMALVDSAGAATAAVLASSQRSRTLAKGGVLDIDTEVRVGDSVSESAPKEDRVTVEAYAMQHYAASGGWTGVHCEGGLFHTLFGLLMWEILFMDVTDAFQCPFQDGPLDLDFADCFYVNRKVAIEGRLRELTMMTPPDIVKAIRIAYLTHYKKVCRGVSWSTSMQLLQLIGVCLSGPTLAHIFHTMCSNHKHFSAGLPDLFMWRVLAPQGVPFVHCLPAHRLSRCEDVVDLTLSQDSSDVVATSAVVASAGATTSSSPASVPVTLSVEDTPSSLPSLTVSGGPVDPFQDVPDYQLVPGAVYQCRCVEVKGPRDRLSDKQEAWIHLLLDAGCDVDVCHVRESNHKDVAVLVASGKSKTL